MAKKMIRRLIMISAVLFLLVGSQANADCDQDCLIEYYDCLDDAWDYYYICMANDEYNNCMIDCVDYQHLPEYWCETVYCAPYYVYEMECLDIAAWLASICQADYGDCLDACY